MIVKKRYGRETGREYALRVLKENIVMLELEPGSRISENELASEIGVSRTPIREALIEDVYKRQTSNSLPHWNL